MQEKNSSSQRLLEGDDEGINIPFSGNMRREIITKDPTSEKEPRREGMSHRVPPMKGIETEHSDESLVGSKEFFYFDQEEIRDKDEEESEEADEYQNRYYNQNEKNLKEGNNQFIGFDKDENIIFPQNLYLEIGRSRTYSQLPQLPTDSKEKGKTLDDSQSVGWAHKCRGLLHKYFGFVKQDKVGKKSKMLEQQQKKVRDAMKKRKIMRYIAYFTYVAMIAVGLILFFKYSIVRNAVYFDNVSASNPTLKLAVDNCSLYIMDPDQNNISAPIYVQYFMPPGHESGSASVGSQIITEDSLTVNILNAGDPYYCLAKLFIKADTITLSSFEIACGKCNITQDTSAQIKIDGLLNISGDSVHANFRNVKVGSLAYESFTGHLQFNNIESGPGVNNIEISGEGDIIIQSVQDYVVNATTNTQAFCFGGTSLTSFDNGTCIYSDQDQPVPSRYKTCSLSWSVCINQDCNLDSYPTYVVNSTNGNIYANVIPKVGSPVIPNQIVSGQIYNQGISFSPTAETVLEAFDQYVADPDKSNPFVVLNVGDIASRSSKYAKWIVSSVPSYALMKPWWIGTFSASLLNGYVKGANGILLPGFCPFYPDYINQDLLSMQNLIYTKIKTPQTLVTFVVDESMPAPTNHHQNYTGVFPLIEGGNPSDRWFSLALSAGGNMVLENNDFTKRGEILGAIIVSLVIAFYVIYLTLSITLVSINMIYRKLVDFSSHLLNYSKLEQSKLKQKSEDFQKVKSIDEAEEPSVFSSAYNYSFMKFLKHAPSPLAFIDYVSLIFLRQFSNSVVQFYFLLFREYTGNDDQELDPNRNLMKGTEVKALYEKFCFMNHFYEQKLTDPMNQAVLRSYGFEIKIREDLKSQVFTKLIIKNKTPYHVSSRQLKNRTSLDYYIQENVKLTQFNEDQIEVSEFTKLYEEFCDFNKFASIPISPSLMKDKYSINMTFLPQQYILRVQEHRNTILDTGYNLLMSITKQNKKYVIDKSKLENHFKLIMNDTSEMTIEEISEATSDLILYPSWPLWDAFTVLLHLLLGALITFPLVYFVILNESQYQPWSLKDNQYLIRYNDCVHDPYQCVKNLYSSFTWNVVLMVVATVLLIFSSLDLMLYYAIMEFPQDKSFKKSQKKVEEKFLERFSRQVEWIFVLFALIFYFGYTGLVLIWLLLGAFINPTTFLPFASAAVTFVVFIVSKFNSFKDISKQGTRMIRTYVSKLFKTFTSKVLTKVSKSFENAQFLQQKEFNKLNETKTLNEVLGVGIVTETKSDVPASVPVKTNESENTQEESLSQALEPKRPAITRDPRFKKILEIKTECDKRKFPQEITNLMLSIFAQDEPLQKKYLKSVLHRLNKKEGLSKDAGEIMAEIIFPQGIKKEETVQFIKILILTFVLNETNMKNVKGLTGETLHEMFSMFKLLDQLNYDSFLRKFRQRFIKAKKLSFDDIFQPILDIAAVISKEKPDYWNVKHYCFKLLRIAIYLHSKEVKANPMISETQAIEDQKKCEATLENFIKFLPLIFSAYGVPYDVDDPKKLFDSKESLRIIENFCAAAGIPDKSNQHNENTKYSISVSDLIFLGISTLKHESGDLPRRVTRAIEEAFQVEIPSNKFLSFCLNLTNVLYNKPHSFYKRLSLSGTEFAVPSDLQKFLKLITCCHMRGFEAHYPPDLIEKNPYFMKIAQLIKVKPNELLGLIYLIYGKRNNKYVFHFFQAILTRMNLNRDLLETLIAVASIFFFEDEASLFKAINTLDLDHGHFLLIGKHALNPKFLPKSDFTKLNISSALPALAKKDTIYYDTYEQFANWKLDIRNELDSKILEASANEDQEIGEGVENLELIKFYFSDWRNFNFSRKNIEAAIKALNNPEKNDLKAKLMNTEPGKDYTGIDYLIRIVLLSNLQLQNGKKFIKLDKEKESALVTFAAYLGCDSDILAHFMKIFFTTDKDTVINSFFALFPEEKENETKISKMLSFCFVQVSGIQKQLEFINDDFSNSIDFFGKADVKVPPNLIKKIYFGSSYGDLDINDILELVSLKIDSLYDSGPKTENDLKAKVETKTDTPSKQENDKEILRQKCLDLSFFSKGIVLNSFQTDISPKVVDLIQIFSETNVDNKYSHITELFPRYKNEPEHPIKLAMALYGTLNHSKFTVRSGEAIDRKQKKKLRPEDSDVKKKILVQHSKVFLGDAFKIHPEFFDIPELIFERDASKFFQKSLPLFRRLTGSSIVDASLLESVFSLSVGEKFNAYYLSQKLGISPDIIDFFISMIRISKKSTRKKELQAIEDSIAVAHILEKLKIIPSEFFNLLKLIFNRFEIKNEEILEILRDIGIKGEEDEADLIQIELLKGLFAITSFTDPRHNFMKNKKDLVKLQPQVAKFWNVVELSNLQKDALLISTLAAGNFLVLEEFKNCLNWAFPNDDPKAGKTIMNLTMGLCGIINSGVEMYSDLNADVEAFVDSYPINADSAPNQTDPSILPNNSLAYSIYLTSTTLDISPKWIQAFMLDKKAIKAITDRIPNINKEFVLGVVLQFRNLNEVVGDLLGLYEWTVYCKENAGDLENNKITKAQAFLDKTADINKFFKEKINFKHQVIKEMAASNGLLADSFWKGTFDDSAAYNYKINQSLFYLLTNFSLTKTKIEKLADQLKMHFCRIPIEFLEELGHLLDVGLPKEKEISGELIRKAIVTVYEVVCQKVSKNQQRYSGFALTDLCTIADLTDLRSSSNFSFARKLHHLHQIMINIERKNIFDEVFHKMSKFKIMKLLGIALNIQLSDAFEDCLKHSLFHHESVKKYAECKPEEKENVKEEICKLFLYDPENSGQPKLSIGDLGYYPGDYANYASKMNAILDADNWEKINMILEFDSVYSVHRQNDYQDLLKKNNGKIPEKDDAELFEITLMNPNMAMIQGLIRGDPTDILDGDHVLNQQDITRESTKLYIAIIGLQSYWKMENKNRLAFSSYLRTLSSFMKSDILALDEILEFLVTRKGNFNQTTNILDISDNILNLLLISVRNGTKDDEEDEPSYSKDPSKYHSNVSSSLSDSLKTVISDEYLESFIRLREIYLLRVSDGLKFFVHGLRRDLSKEEENYLTKQLAKINQKLWHKKDKEPEKIKHHPLEKLVQMIDFEKLKKQIKTEDKKIINAFKNAPKEEDEAIIAILDEIVLPYYYQLREEKEKTGKNKKGKEKQTQYKDILEEKKTLRMNFRIINSLLQQDFSQAFDLMVLNCNPGENECIKAEKILKEFMWDTEELKASDVSYFVLYVTFAQNNLSSFRNHKNYSKTIQRITQQIVDRNVLNPYTVPEETQGSKGKKSVEEKKKFDNESVASLSELMLGAFAWDFNLCIKALASDKTLDEAFLLYNLYACLNMDKILAINEKSSDKDKGDTKSEKSITSEFSKKDEATPLHLKALLPLIYPKVLANAPKDINLREKYRSYMKEHINVLHKNSDEELAKGLVIKSQILFDEMLSFENDSKDASGNKEKKQAKQLSKLIRKSLKSRKPDEVFNLEGSNELKKYGIFEEILCSFCDGKVLKKLIDTFLQEETGKKIVKKLFKFFVDFKAFRSKKKSNHNHARKTFEKLIYAISELNKFDVWKKVVELSPILLNILFIIQREEGVIAESQKEEIRKNINQLLDLNPKGVEKDPNQENQKELLLDIVDVMLSTSKFRYDLEFDKMTSDSFDKLCDKLFLGIIENEDFKTKHLSVYSLFAVLNVEYVEKVEDKKNRFKIIKSLLDIFEDLKLCSSKLHIDILLNLLNGNLTGSEKLIQDFNEQYSDDTSLLIRDYFLEAQKYFKSEPFGEIKPSILFSTTPQQTTNKKKMDNDEWIQIMKKIKEGNTTSKDLFKMVDQEGDHNGSINESEFLVLAGRLGLKLSDHRVKEIFAKVKGVKVQDADCDELNEEEFEKALAYLEEKNLQQALELLGITPEILTAILIRLTILLLLIFVFLYLGLKAFTIGGTFGSIVNSIFPIAGGVALGKDKQGEENLDEEKVKDATDKGFNIATSAEL